MDVNRTEILHSIRRERRNSEWIDKSMSTLRKKFGGRYIAVKNRRVVDSDEEEKKKRRAKKNALGTAGSSAGSTPRRQK